MTFCSFNVCSQICVILPRGSLHSIVLTGNLLHKWEESIYGTNLFMNGRQLKILWNFQLKNEASKTNFDTYKRIILELAAIYE